MSVPAGKLPLPELAEMKRRGDKIVMVTAYDAPGARFAEDAGVDVILVGDTAAMVMLGHEGTTVPVTMDEMLFLTRTVARAARRPIVVGDMPFGSYQVSDEEAVTNAIRFVKEARADVVKLEGAGASLSRVRAIVDAGIPVMGHIGLTPQSATMLGGFKTQGRTAEKARRLLDEARALEAAGCFSIVLEAVPSPVAARITETVAVPTIGIGAGPSCDGQVLVYHDLLGLSEGHLPSASSSAMQTSRARFATRSRPTQPTSARERSRRTSTRTRWRKTSSPRSTPTLRGTPNRSARGLSGKWPRWMTGGTGCEARTQRAPICRHIGATEDAASQRVTPVRRPGSLSGQAPSGHSLGDAIEHVRRSRQRDRTEVTGDPELRERRAEMKSLPVAATELRHGLACAAVSMPSATTSSPSDDASRTIASTNTRST